MYLVTNIVVEGSTIFDSYTLYESYDEAKDKLLSLVHSYMDDNDLDKEQSFDQASDEYWGWGTDQYSDYWPMSTNLKHYLKSNLISEQ